MNALDTPVPRRMAGIGLRQVRIACGLVLFTYLVSHYVNHALGNVSYAVMEAGLDYHMGFWRYPPVAAVFLTAGLVHWGLGLWALYERRAFRYPRVEVTQLALGVSIPFLLAVHFVGGRMQAPLFGRDIHYAQVLIAYWINRPWQHWLQYALLAVAWTHGCIGLYYWLRLRRWFAAAAPYLLACAVLLPAFAFLGLVHGATEAHALFQQPEWRKANFTPPKISTPPQRMLLDDLIVYVLAGYAVVVATIFAARGARLVRERRRGTVRLNYGNGRNVRVPLGMSVLEASLRHRIPHASVCGARHAARRAGSALAATRRRCHDRRHASGSCSIAWVPEPIPRCASHANCARRSISRSTWSCR